MFKKVDFDSQGNMYIPAMNLNAIYKLSPNQNGMYYLGAIITDQNTAWPSSVAVSNDHFMFPITMDSQ